MIDRVWPRLAPSLRAVGRRLSVGKARQAKLLDTHIKRWTGAKLRFQSSYSKAGNSRSSLQRSLLLFATGAGCVCLLITALAPGEGGFWPNGNTAVVAAAAPDDDSRAAKKKKKLVILGSGWGAVSLLKNLSTDDYDVAVVSPQNYFLFTPLLPSVTVGTVEARSIVEPIRKLLGKKKRETIKFYEAECNEILVPEKKIRCKDSSAIVGAEDEFTLDYDLLVVAIGAKTNTYNIKGIKEHTHYLKEIFDAQKIRKNVMDSFETAAIPNQPEEEIKRLLHFVVVGGGPTGVEFAAELRDFVTDDLSKLYPQLHEKVTITLIDGYNKILNTYDDEISRYTEERFKADKIDVVKSTFVTGVDESRVTIMDANTKEKATLPYGMCVWAAGLGPQQLTKDLIAKIPNQTNRNALQTNGYLQVKNAPGIFALGDCATIEVKLMVAELEQMFKEADKNSDGTLNVDEFKAIMVKAQKQYPQATLFFTKAIDLEDDASTMRLFSKADKDHSDSLSIDEFRTVLQNVDEGTTALPATAQVAAQQGKYLSKLLSSNADLFRAVDQGGAVDLRANGLLPFDYQYLGSFAYVGDNRAVLKLPVLGSFKGLGTMWLWRAAYTNECMSMRMRTLVLFDWMKSAVFGRDTSRI